jgi:hypothetical protein
MSRKGKKGTKNRKTASRQKAPPERGPGPAERWAQRAWIYLQKPWVIPAMLGLVAVLVSATFFNPLLSTIGDNAQYVVLGKSLLAGKGLSHINSPDQKPDTKYPFMFPLILAAVMAVAPDNVVALKMVGVIACVGAAMLYYPALRRRSEPLIVIAAAALSVVNPDILRHSTIILAEVPFLFTTFLALLWIAYAEERFSERTWVPVALLLIMVAYYLKAVAIALGAGVFLFLLLRRRIAWAFGFAGGFALLAFPWVLRSQRVGDGRTYIHYLLQKNPYRPFEGTASATDLLVRLGGNVEIYFYRIIPESLLPFLRAENASPGEGIQLLLLLASAVTAVGLVYRLARHRTVADLYLLSFLGICALWPRVWAGARFIVPVIPLLFFCCLTGLWLILSVLPRKGVKYARESVIVVLSASMLVATVWTNRAEARIGREYTPDWESYFAAARWAHDHTPPESVFVCRKPYLFYLASGRRSMGYRFSEDPEEVELGFREVGATHIVVDQFQWTGTSMLYLVPTVMADPESYPVVHATELEPRTIVTRFLDTKKEEES